ncbi:MAG TPA: hypothetical protein VGN16_23115 [Acidobacteriaceae bacterium]|jgi:hypothetical protein
MEVIGVPGPPKEAFNKNRRISDLIRAQITHLKHLEDKLPATVRSKFPQHAIVTENDAAIYIAAMTRWLRSQNNAPTGNNPVKPASSPAGVPVSANSAKQPSSAAKAKLAASPAKKVTPARAKRPSTASKARPTK